MFSGLLVEVTTNVLQPMQCVHICSTMVIRDYKDQGSDTGNL